MYLSAYALALSRILFRQTDGLDRLAVSIDKVYKKFDKILTPSDLTNEEIAGIAVSECNYKYFEDENKLTQLFDISKKKLDKLKSIIKGEV